MKITQTKEKNKIIKASNKIKVDKMIFKDLIMALKELKSRWKLKRESNNLLMLKIIKQKMMRFKRVIK